ncbi:hypothetical protein BP6252_09960 [Coleophoma cylindrospora]|uniref:Phytanoyl-CoA dioxygenase family protein n=1 Tax=Coleophoma cylindrospora TaxID=1849047 RepID=A0A3D8QX40_9HELO|nr:hypothetical protein BP6252_09960 [Coleophoma cylindrospora]
MAPDTTYLESLKRDGFVVIPNLLSGDKLEQLRSACSETTKFARAGHWPHVRTLPKQFPPWNPTPGGNPAAEGIWGVQFLMHPEQPNHELFTQQYFAADVLEIVKGLLQCADADLVMELYNLLVRPDHDFELRWHRDSIAWEATAEEELQRLNEPAWHAQWNMALYDDASLIVVPGSHARAKTEAERAAHPFAKDMPGQLVVKMKAGDAVFYNNNIVHRGVYDSGVERMTLHGSMGHMNGSELRARNVLQHGMREWIADVDLGVVPEGAERERAGAMRERLVELGKVTGDVGFELEE